MRRREFVSGLLAASAVGSAGIAVQAKSAEVLQVPAEAPPVGSAPREAIVPLLEPLQVGDHIGLGWRLWAMSDISAGGCVLSLRRDGQLTEFRVHLCRKSGASRGAAHSDTVDFLLMNDGDGSVPTDETLGRVLNTLAELVRRNERAGVATPAALMSHESRLRAFGSARALV